MKIRSLNLKRVYINPLQSDPFTLVGFESLLWELSCMPDRNVLSYLLGTSMAADYSSILLFFILFLTLSLS